MHLQLETALIVAALVAAILLVLHKGDRLFPAAAVIAAGLEALIVFGVVTLSVSKFRIDVVLPAVLALAGAVCWARATAKTAITASTVVLLVGLIQLLVAVKVFR